MAGETSALSIPDIERLLDEQKNKLLGLVRQREKLQKDIDAIDEEIQRATDLRGAARRPRKKRMSNAAPLRVVVQGILKTYKKGLPLDDLTAKVSETGYRSTSSNLRNVVYQSVYNSSNIEFDAKSGNYRLKK